MLMQLFAGSAGPAQDGALQASFDAWSVQDGQISIPRETASRLLQIRAEHAAFVFDLGKAQAGRLPLCDALKQGSALSMWWCSLLYERHPKVTPMLYEVYRLRAVELAMLERGCTALAARGLSRPACQALAAMCRRRGWSFEAIEQADAGADILTLHREVLPDAEKALRAIKALGVKCGLSIKPGTGEETLFPYLDQIDNLLVMTVEPGFGGQKFMPDELEKIRRLRRAGYRGDIAVDGGVNLENAPEIVKAGANVLVMGTAYFRAEDPAGVARAVREMA